MRPTFVYGYQFADMPFPATMWPRDDANDLSILACPSLPGGVTIHLTQSVALHQHKRTSPMAAGPDLVVNTPLIFAKNHFLAAN